MHSTIGPCQVRPVPRPADSVCERWRTTPQRLVGTLANGTPTLRGRLQPAELGVLTQTPCPRCYTRRQHPMHGKPRLRRYIEPDVRDQLTAEFRERWARAGYPSLVHHILGNMSEAHGISLGVLKEIARAVRADHEQNDPRPEQGRPAARRAAGGSAALAVVDGSNLAWAPGRARLPGARRGRRGAPPSTWPARCSRARSPGPRPGGHPGASSHRCRSLGAQHRGASWGTSGVKRSVRRVWGRLRVGRPAACRGRVRRTRCAAAGRRAGWQRPAACHTCGAARGN